MKNGIIETFGHIEQSDDFLVLKLTNLFSMILRALNELASL